MPSGRHHQNRSQQLPHWGLTGVQPASNLSYNFVAFANHGDEQVILKMGVPNRELKSEMAALLSSMEMAPVA